MDDPTTITSPTSPVWRHRGEPKERGPKPGIALCLSGGGYRAMLFHLGALWRLNELGYLPKLSCVSSVSGGSITAGLLWAKWRLLDFDSNGIAQGFDTEMVDPIRALASTTVSWRVIALGLIGGPFGLGWVSDRLAGAYSRHLYGKATLDTLADHPRFIVNATNLQSGARWWFEKASMGDWQVGRVASPKGVPLAKAVAASSAFPPFLAPASLKLKQEDFAAGSGEGLEHPPYTTSVRLTDGGVYDNLGIERPWKDYQTILVSDAGGKQGPEPRPRLDWFGLFKRSILLIYDQVGNGRRRQVVGSFGESERAGTYWGIHTDIARYRCPDALPCDPKATHVLAATGVDLAKLDPTRQERLIDWGYAVCDAAMRRWVDRTLPKPPGFPYPGSGIG